MEMRKKYLFWLAVSALFLPFVLSYLPVNEYPADAMTLENDTKIEKPSFDWKNFLSDSIKISVNGKDSTVASSVDLMDKLIGEHFEKISAYCNQNFGLRPIYVRLRNQFDFSLFGKAHAKGVIVGKDGYLYEEQYIKSYYGNDFIGQDSINQRVEKLKFVQQELEKQGKLVFVVIAPGKGYFYPEYIPEVYGKKIGKTNYEGFVEAFKKNGINYLDFNKHFVNQKKSSAHVLYPKTGIHWSQYAMYQALDSITKYIEIRKGVDLRDITIDKNPNKTKELKFKDNDIEKGLNLFTDLGHLEMSYPKFSFGPPEGKAKPTLLTISDSFFWQIYDLGTSHELFNNGKFWFYNQTVHPNTEEQGRPVFANEFNLFEELQKNDIIWLMATDANLHKFPYGFIDEAEATLKTGLEAYNKRIAEITNQIKTTPDWLRDVKEKAIKNGITLDEQILLDAQWAYKEELSKAK